MSKDFTHIWYFFLPTSNIYPVIYFSTLFKKETGQNFTDYLTELRINKAKELLSGDKVSVQDVAEMVGYSDLKYFSRLFKKTTGVSPSDYKKLYK